MVNPGTPEFYGNLGNLASVGVIKRQPHITFTAHFNSFTSVSSFPAEM